MKIETKTILRLRDLLLRAGRRPSLVPSSAFETLARMGFLSDDEREAIRDVSPVAEAMYLMMAVDGVVGDAEQDAIRGAIRGLTDEQLRTGTIRVLMEEFGRQLAAEGREARLKALGERLSREPHAAECAFCLAAATALADDVVADEENEFINQLAQWFGISPKRAEEILDDLEEDRAGPSEHHPG